MAALNEIGIAVNRFGQLLGYQLEEQALDTGASRRKAQPAEAQWVPVGVAYHPEEPVRIRASGGLFGSTAEVEIYPLGKKVRTPDDIKNTHVFLAGSSQSIGVLTVTRG